MGMRELPGIRVLPLLQEKGTKKHFTRPVQMHGPKFLRIGPGRSGL